jgi:C-terminal processing protease CtpA/Prc
MKKIFYLAILSAVFISACKKDKKPGNTDLTGPSKTGSTLNLIQDSVFLYAQEDYLWNTSLPTYATFKPRSYTNADDLTALTNELNALSQYAINPSTNLPYEYYKNDPGQAKYSFIDDGTETAALNGVKGDFGFDVQYNDVNDLRIEYVYAGSPAGLAGLKRGYQITSINGNTNISYDAKGFGSGTSTNLNFVSNAIYNSGSVSMTVLTQAGKTLTVNLAVANYNVNPVLKDTVFNQGNGHIIGYVVFNSFTSSANADPLLNSVFSYFTTQGVTDLVVDLRYNGGGYVSTAEYLDNLIVPSSKNGSLMYNTYYNTNLVQGKDPLLKNQWRKDPSGGPDYNYSQFDYSVAGNAVNFSKIGQLNVNRVFFIITGQTASASELTINNLRPVLDVQFVGGTSYGKPVGFFDIDINKYIMYTPEFSVQNSAGQGGYYSGFTPGTSGYPGIQDYDDLTKDWGDPTEGLLAHILTDVNTGSYTVTNNTHVPSINNSLNAVPKSTFSMQQKNQAAILLKSMNIHKMVGMIGKKNLKFKNTLN